MTAYELAMKVIQFADAQHDADTRRMYENSWYGKENLTAPLKMHIVNENFAKKPDCSVPDRMTKEVQHRFPRRLIICYKQVSITINDKVRDKSAKGGNWRGGIDTEKL